MTIEAPVRQYRTIFAPSTPEERTQNFENYWHYTLASDGDLFEDQKTLSIKNQILLDFQNNQVRSRQPLPQPGKFYRNYIRLQEDPGTLDSKTLLLTCIYKFARHEWTGISAAWETTPPFEQTKTLTDKISRYHLCEEFCHVRLFHEMFRTFHLDEVEWVPMGRFSRWLYGYFSKLPENVMSTPAFLSELMGLTFYLHLDALLDEVLHDEPEARGRIRDLLHEIMVDELAHIGQRRNYLGERAIRWAKRLFPWMVRGFWRDIPEGKILFNIPRMIQDGLAFDYRSVPRHLLARTWVPSYCRLD